MRYDVDACCRGSSRASSLSFAYLVGFPFKAWGWSHSGYYFLSFTSHLLTCGPIADPYKSRALYSLKVSKSGTANSMGKFPRYHFVQLWRLLCLSLLEQ